jgi:hypothetical protein
MIKLECGRNTWTNLRDLGLLDKCQIHRGREATMEKLESVHLKGNLPWKGQLVASYIQFIDFTANRKHPGIVQMIVERHDPISVDLSVPSANCEYQRVTTGGDIDSKLANIPISPKGSKQEVDSIYLPF